MTDSKKPVHNSELDKLKKRVAALEDRAKDAAAAIAAVQQLASQYEAENKELSELLARSKAAQDPLPDEFDKGRAASTVNRLLGIAEFEMSDDVEALLWTYALRRLGVLSGDEYERRKKRLLARDIDAAPSPEPPAAKGRRTHDESTGESKRARPTGPSQQEGQQ
ncbi:MAG: hypothetical protein M3O70_00865 [Actinomycetota bacterium]|nr:hypothetical protein [Actinomycetota bacterium]